jgi:hypothetical protein
MTITLYATPKVSSENILLHQEQKRIYETQQKTEELKAPLYCPDRNNQNSTPVKNR